MIKYFADGKYSDLVTCQKCVPASWDCLLERCVFAMFRYRRVFATIGEGNRFCSQKGVSPIAGGGPVAPPTPYDVIFHIDDAFHSFTMAALRVALLACVVAAASAFSAGPA